MLNFSSFFDSRESRNLENEKKWLENSRDLVKSCFFHHPSYIHTYKSHEESYEIIFLIFDPINGTRWESFSIFYIYSFSNTDFFGGKDVYFLIFW